MSVPNLKHIVEQARALYPEAWANAHTGNEHTEDFIRLCAPMLKDEDSRFGLNGKRGNPHDISDDAVNCLCDEADSDGRTPVGQPCVVIDVIGAAGAKPPYTPQNPAPFVAWGVYNTKVEGSGAHVDPSGAPPQPPQYPSYEELGGDEGGKKITRVLEHDYRWAMRPGLDGECGAWIRRTDYDFLAGLVKPVEASIVKHRDEWLYELGLIRVEHGMMANGYICKICGASVGVEKGKPIPLIPHAADCMTKPITA